MYRQSRAIIIIAATLSASCSESSQPIAQQQFSSIENLCLNTKIDLAATVTVIGVYQGQTLHADEDESPGDRTTYISDRTGTIKVTGVLPNGPRYLVLTSYEPVTWDFTGANATGIRAVIAYGYYEPKILGLPKEIPIRTVSWPNLDGPCRKPIIAYKGGVSLDALVEQNHALLGLKTTEFIGAYEGNGIDFSTQQLSATRETASKIQVSSDRTDEAYVDSMPNAKAIQSLIDDGALRRATQRDVDLWNRAASKLHSTDELAPFVSEYLMPNEALVIEKPFKLPADMYGANARMFIIMGSPELKPYDSGSHNSYFYVTTGRCEGAAPDCRSDAERAENGE